MWFDKQSYLQSFAGDFNKILTDNGWTLASKFRINNLTKYIEVKLYESLGSDNELRKFGTAYAYDTADSDFADSRFIPNNSPLGLLGLSDGVKTKYSLPCAPVIGGTLKVYGDGQIISSASYTVDAAKGEVTFTAIPAKDVRLTCEYQLSPTAHEPSNDLFVFTYGRFGIYFNTQLTDPSANLGLGDGTKKTFNLNKTGIDYSTLLVFKKVNNGTPTQASASEYTVDATTGAITFTVAPPSTTTILVSYSYEAVPANGNDYGDISTLVSFDPQSMTDVMTQVYSAGVITTPSPPMSLAFNPAKRYTNEWQRDSNVYLYGNVNKDRIIMFIRIDPTGNPTAAYFVPLYIGKLNTFGNKPRKNMLMFGGTRTGDAFANATDKKLGNVIVDYGSETANGNMVASLQQSFSGAMYQNHYFSFITHDKEVDNGQGRYNPSVYSDKYHLSQIYIVHPNDGQVGRLDDVYAVHPKNIQQADELEIVKTVDLEEVGIGDGSERFFHLEHKPKKDTTLTIEVNCVVIPSSGYTFDPDTKMIKFNTPPVGKIIAKYQFSQLYRYTLATTPVSPCTQDKATPFNPIGLAIYKEEL